jgi:hypothetical protein
MEPLPSIQTRHTRDEEEGEAEVQGEDNGGASEARNGHDELEAACLHRATHRPEPDLLGYFGTNRAGSGGDGTEDRTKQMDGELEQQRTETRADKYDGRVLFVLTLDNPLRRSEPPPLHLRHLLPLIPRPSPPLASSSSALPPPLPQILCPCV